MGSWWWYLLFSTFHYPPALAIFVSALVLLNRKIHTKKNCRPFLIFVLNNNALVIYADNSFLSFSLSFFRCYGSKCRRSDFLLTSLYSDWAKPPIEPCTIMRFLSILDFFQFRTTRFRDWIADCRVLLQNCHCSSYRFGVSGCCVGAMFVW